MHQNLKNSEALDLERQKAWNRQLYRWWELYNDEYLGCQMIRPIIRIGSAERTLGFWDSKRRTLTISTLHIERDPWLSVMDTLRHEMAHQYVDEVLKVKDQPPHGPAFAETCKRLRCSPHPQATEQDLRHDHRDRDDDLTRVFKKLMALADSPNEHEAQAALKKARSLLVKYNIQLVEFDRERQFETRSLGEVKGRHMAYELSLASLLNRFFFVEVIWQHSYDSWRDRLGTALQIFGTSKNLDMAEYVYSYLREVLDGLWLKYKRTRGLGSNRERQRYFDGVIQGFYRKLRDQEKIFEPSQDLVWNGDAHLKAYYRYMNPRVRLSYGRGARQTAVYRDGVKTGHKVSINNPIPRPTGRSAGYLESRGSTANALERDC